MRSLANDRNILIKKAYKGSCVVVWDREGYIAEAERQLEDKNVYKDIDFKGKISELAETSDLSRNLKKRVVPQRRMSFIWTHGQGKLTLFLEDLNKCHPNIKFTHETNKEDIVFLDLQVKLLDGKKSTDLFVKSTDRHQFLHYTSSHPEQAKRLIVFSQALRVSRICSY